MVCEPDSFVTVTLSEWLLDILRSDHLSDASLKRIRDTLESYEGGTYDVLDDLLAALHACSAEFAKDEDYR